MASLRFILLFSLAAAHLLGSEAPDDLTRQLITETARGLWATQRPDGSWLGPDTTPNSDAAASATDNDALRFRSQVLELCRAAEALWSIQDLVPEAVTAASRAQELAARAVEAGPHGYLSSQEGIAFLRAERARGTQGKDLLQKVAHNARFDLNQEIARGSMGPIHLGIPVDDGGIFRVDLLATWRVIDLDPNGFHAWLPTGSAKTWPRVSRYQAVLPVPSGDRAQQIPAVQPFEDGSAFAAALSRKCDWHIMEWLRPICEQEDAQRAEPERLLAYLRIFRDDRPYDRDDWRQQCMKKWTDALMDGSQHRDHPTGPLLLWPTRAPYELANGFGLRWLHALRRAQEPLPYETWMRQRIKPRLTHFAETQEVNGRWVDTQSSEDCTALICLSFLINGYDHKTPNKYKKLVSKALEALLETDPTQLDISAQALHLMAISEAYAQTSDQTLKSPTENRVRILEASALPTGGWPTRAGAELDWKSTSLAIMALWSAKTGGIDTSIDRIAVWWTGQSDEGMSFSDLTWKAASGTYLGKPAWEATKALVHRLQAALPREQLPFDQGFAYASASFQVDGKGWTDWLARAMAETPNPSQLDHIAWQLLADCRIQRYFMVHKSVP